MTTKQIQIELPVELTENATEEQMNIVAATLGAYIKSANGLLDEKQLQESLLLLSGCAQAIAEGFAQAFERKH
ncbi:hypothetical protein [Vibrio sp.]|uniref:hypothetical protein n=1 Tax=Vibrio sp. TaxID=678 RepID=UPI003AA88B86